MKNHKRNTWNHEKPIWNCEKPWKLTWSCTGWLWVVTGGYRRLQGGSDDFSWQTDRHFIIIYISTSSSSERKEHKQAKIFRSADHPSRPPSSATRYLRHLSFAKFPFFPPKSRGSCTFFICIWVCICIWIFIFLKFTNFGRCPRVAVSVLSYWRHWLPTEG